MVPATYSPQVIRAGFDLDAIPRVERYLRSSAATTALSCSQRGQYETVHKRVPAKRAGALTIGTIWHAVREDLSRGLDPQTVVEDAVLAARAEHEDTGADDLRRFAEDLPYIVREFRQSRHAPSILFTERPFWLQLDDLVVLGQFDSAFTSPRGSMVGEIKTISGNASHPDYIAARGSAIQQMVYTTAADILLDDYRGIRYEFLRKNWRPKRASGGLSLEERMEQWPRTLFHDEEILHTPCADTLYTHLDAAWRLLHEEPPLRNTLACMTFGKVVCPYFDVCHRDYPLSGLDFDDRPEDYVDRALTLKDQNDA